MLGLIGINVPDYATFWLDPFGMMLEAACHHADPLRSPA